MYDIDQLLRNSVAKDDSAKGGESNVISTGNSQKLLPSHNVTLFSERESSVINIEK